MLFRASPNEDVSRPPSSESSGASANDAAVPAGTPSRDATGAALDALSAHNAATACASAPVSPSCCATRTVSFRALSASSARPARTCARASDSAAACNRRRESACPSALVFVAVPAAPAPDGPKNGVSGGKKPNASVCVPVRSFSFLNERSTPVTVGWT